MIRRETTGLHRRCAGPAPMSDPVSVTEKRSLQPNQEDYHNTPDSFRLPARKKRWKARRRERNPLRSHSPKGVSQPASQTEDPGYDRNAARHGGTIAPRCRLSQERRSSAVALQTVFQESTDFRAQPASHRDWRVFPEREYCCVLRAPASFRLLDSARGLRPGQRRSLFQSPRD